MINLFPSIDTQQTNVKPPGSLDLPSPWWFRLTFPTRFVPIYLLGDCLGARHEHTNHATDKQNSANRQSNIAPERMRGSQEIYTSDESNNANSDCSIENGGILHFVATYLF